MEIPGESIQVGGLQCESQFVRVGAVSYLNSKPLIHGLASALEGAGVLSLDLPSKLADDLAAGQIDIGLIPVVEFFQHPEFRSISTAVIACKGPVWSVRIFFRCDPKDVRVLALDDGSRTSVALSKVLFKSRYGFVPETIPLTLADDPMSSLADAVLVIGDRAMHPEVFRPIFSSDWDLGQAWLEETGLPFVFALWACRHECFVTEKMERKLEAARDRGFQSVREIATANAAKYRLTAEQCLDYLTNYIRFELNSEEQAGLDEFRLRCRRMGLVPSIDF